MKKIIAIVLAVMMMFVITGCGDTSQKSSTIKDNTKQEQKADKSSADSSKNTVVSERAGLGNTLDAWTKEYGSPKSHGEALKGFEHDAMLVTFENNKAVNITFKKIQMSLIKQVTPKDGEQLSKSSKKTSNGERVVKKYHSKLLEAAIPATDGNYTIIESYEGSNMNLISVVIDCTPNLGK